MGTGDDYFIHNMHSENEDEMDGYSDQIGALIPFSLSTLDVKSDEVLCISLIVFDQGRDEVMTIEIREADYREFYTPLTRSNSDDGLLLKGVENWDRKCIFEWVLGKLGGFSSFLGVPLVGLEDEVLEIFSIIEERSLKALWMSLSRIVGAYGVS